MSNRLLRTRWRLLLTGLGALAITGSLVLGGIGGQATPAAADEIMLIRPGHTGPEQRLDVNGTLIAVTHVADTAQADLVFFQGAHDAYERAATDPNARPYGLFLTYDIDGQAALMVLDLSWLRDEDGLAFANLMLYDPSGGPGPYAVRNVSGTHASVQLLLHPQEDGTYLAREYRELAKGAWSMTRTGASTNRTPLGTIR
jgi:hypothetical protein